MTKLARLIAREEGFGKPGAIPTIRNNPGDLRHSPHSTHPGGDQNAIGTIDTVEYGWEDLERQLALYAERGFTLREAIYEWAPPGDGNDTVLYLSNMIWGLNGIVTPDTPLAEVLKIQEDHNVSDG